MAYCSKCGAELSADNAFCPKCGQPVSTVSGGASGSSAGAPAVAATAQSGLSENVAGLLCYLVGWVTGIIFLLIDKRPFVKFHAAQSIVLFGGLHIINILVGIIFGAGFMMMGHFGVFGLGAALWSLVGIVAFILWIVLMIKAYQHQRFELPVVGAIAKGLSGT